MKTIFRSYKFELRPTKTQEVLLVKHFGCVRFVYNHFLNEKIEQYKETKTSDSRFEQQKTLTKLKKEELTIWLKEVNSQSLQYSLKCLDDAYKNFYKGNAKFPKFKSAKNKNSFSVPQYVKQSQNRIIIPKFFEGIELIKSRETKGKIKSCTVSKTPSGKYFVSILTEEEYTPKPKTGKNVGIDLGLKEFIITSDGVKFENNRYTRRYASKLSKAQKHLSRKVYKSKTYEKQRRKVARVHEKITNSRNDNLHKVSNQLVTDYDVIVLETLDIKSMGKNKKLAKSIYDASWGEFVRMVEYKAMWNDKQVVKINKWFPSSKTCFVCGQINKELKLSDRVWTCKCGSVHDRDINAAKNILKEGFKILNSAGTVENTNGD